MKVLYKITLVLLFILGLSCQQGGVDRKVDFNRDIRPIFNKRCIVCHGGVKRAGGFSLLFRTDALEPTESGKRAFVPGDPDNSLLLKMVTHSDPAERMPKKDDPLSRQQIELLREWIKQGAEWQDHWAYVKPEPVEPPSHPDSNWPKNEIDLFILNKLQEVGLEPSPPADKPRLLRRVSLDLIGLPPTPEQVETFLQESSDNAYEKAVDRLLASPRFGERWTAMWMDLARYADTKGYERDPGREIWPYRDWLINAFTRDLPFDRFTIEQLAGDLLPTPTPEQYTATAFHRNTMNNDEGGTDNEEYRVAAVIDRVNTTFEVWQGTTMACVQCHSHPYDPFRQKDYYKAFALFNNTRDEDMPHESPVFKFYNEKDQQRVDRITGWVYDHSPGDSVQKEKEARRIRELLCFSEPKIHPHKAKIIRNGTHADTKYLIMYKDGLARIDNVSLSEKKSLMINYNWGKNGTRITILLDSLAGDTLLTTAVTSKHKGHFLYPIAPPAGRHDLYLFFDSDSLEKEQGTCSINWFLFFEGLPGKGEQGYKEIEELFLGLLNKSTKGVPILVENDRDVQRETHLFIRGNWLDPGEKVEPGVPSSLPQLSPDLKADRLAFARWLVSPENPLTARVAVNRFWEQIFGRGIVETVEDFGTQGARPSHAQLLDWLALRFMHEFDWSIKKLLKFMVMSATYQQSAAVSAGALEKDPENRYLSRGPRVRLSAEKIRDQALFVSGLLSDKMFGPSVKPYQPEGVWQIIYSSESWQMSEGEDRYRRAIYTYWRRTSPYPSMITFDCPSREFTVSRRINTNTPLQALVTLNDPVYVEAAAALASLMLNGGENIDEKISFGYRKAMARKPDDAALAVLKDMYEKSRAHFEKEPDGASDLIGAKEADPELASLTMVANTMMNMDEFLNN